MTDREKTLTEIREALQYRHTSSLYDAEYKANVDEWLRFLISELERKDRELESQQEQSQAWYNKLCISQEENRMLREDVQYWNKSMMSYKSMYEEVKHKYETMETLYEDMRKEYLKAQEENGKLREELDLAKTSANIQRRTAVQSLQILQNDRVKLIEGLKEIANEKLLIGSTAIQMKSKARDILIEIGVSVDD